MTSTHTEAKLTELEQAAAGRRSFGNTDLAANAEFKVIAEAMRELVNELRLIRTQLDRLVAVASPDELVAAARGRPPAAKSGGIE